MLEKVRLNDSTASLSEDGKSVGILASGQKYPWPGPVWNGNWNLDGCSAIRIEVENLGGEELSLTLRLDDPAARQNNANWFTANFRVPARTHATQTIEIPNVFPKQLQGKIVGMRGLPGGAKTDAASLDWRDIVTVFVFANNLKKPAKFRLGRITAVPMGVDTDRKMTADWMKMTPEEFFPMIDCYGQFKYEDWPGKIHTDADFVARIASEKADLSANPRPENWDIYGGWKSGPKFKVTGRFRVEKVDGKWWFVDPDGHLFWSHGTDCVGMGNGNGPISFREHYFEGLPETSPFYGSGSCHIGFYKDKGTFRTYNWTSSNLLRKYGPDYVEKHNALAHERLASWGMNTIGNWSDRRISSQNRTPYVTTLGASGRQIEGSNGYWGKFPDPFAEEFRTNIRNAVNQSRDVLVSPWCIGTFVGNELSWGDEFSLSFAALCSPADQPAKVEFVKFLKEKYETVEKLNSVWKSAYASWDEVIQKTDAAKTPTMNDDLGAFYTVIAEQYFRVIHEELLKGAPGTLDLGCRFAWTNDRAAYAMAKYVDVMSYNFYREQVGDFELPKGIDLPTIIGEFHFGALDRGVFHTGLRGAKDQNERAEKYYNYVRSALENPCFVGTHWFQYGAQPTTGRFDGENYQIGLVDIADTPYPETIAKVREIGKNMYEIRTNKQASENGGKAE